MATNAAVDGVDALSLERQVCSRWRSPTAALAGYRHTSAAD
jgi:hypothetical protein